MKEIYQNVLKEYYGMKIVFQIKKINTPSLQDFILTGYCGADRCQGSGHLDDRYFLTMYQNEINIELVDVSTDQIAKCNLNLAAIQPWSKVTIIGKLQGPKQQPMGDINVES